MANRVLVCGFGISPSERVVDGTSLFLVHADSADFLRTPLLWSGNDEALRSPYTIETKYYSAPLEFYIPKVLPESEEAITAALSSAQALLLLLDPDQVRRLLFSRLIPSRRINLIVSSCGKSRFQTCLCLCQFASHCPPVKSSSTRPSAHHSSTFVSIHKWNLLIITRRGTLILFFSLTQQARKPRRTRKVWPRSSPGSVTQQYVARDGEKVPERF